MCFIQSSWLINLKWVDRHQLIIRAPVKNSLPFKYNNSTFCYSSTILKPYLFSYCLWKKTMLHNIFYNIQPSKNVCVRVVISENKVLPLTQMKWSTIRSKSFNNKTCFGIWYIIIPNEHLPTAPYRFKLVHRDVWF